MDNGITVSWASPNGAGGEAHTTLAGLQRAAEAVRGLSEPESERAAPHARDIDGEPDAYERLTEIATLRRELIELKDRIDEAKDRHEHSREWMALKELREQRKELSTKLDVAELGAVRWSQSRLGF
jgi:hypothetical protein